MANGYKGEVELESPTRGKLIVRFGINELAELETAFKVSGIKALQARMQEPGINDARLMVQIALRRHQENFTEEEAGDLMDELGLAPVVAALVQALELAFSGGQKAKSKGTKVPNEKRPQASPAS